MRNSKKNLVADGPTCKKIKQPNTVSNINMLFNTNKSSRFLFKLRRHNSLATGRWFSPGLPVSSTNKTDRHDITEILLKVALNTIKQTNQCI
jgi:hypothetical protein